MRQWLGQRTIMYTLFVLLIVGAQLSFFQPVRDRARRLYFGPIAVLDHSTTRLQRFFSLIRSINQVSKENAQLREKSLEYQAQISELQAVKNENEQLKKDLNFNQTRPDFKLLPAQIINYSPVNSYQAFAINRGSKDGLKEDQAVVSAGFLLGKIKKVSDSTAEVWLLANRNLITPVLLTGSQTTGLLKGGIGGLVISNIPVDAKVQTGEAVVTAGLENVFPAGIAVGTVEEIISNKEEIFISARVSTPINITSLTTVFVLTN